jgi:Pyruvate/2-oxoacid:ferredoxin oxidoreductase gamma subunit
MGASTGIGSGLSLFNDTKKVIAFLGDSTFFHAGLPGILNAIFNKHAVTLVVMENGTTAMTGHQDHPASGKNFNDMTDKIPIRRVLEGLGVKHIHETDTYDQAELTGLITRAMEDQEFSVVIAKHPCMLKFVREQQKKPGYVKRQVKIDQQKCDQIHACVSRFACPTFQRQEDGRVLVNGDLCIGDGSCIQTCPAGAADLVVALERHEALRAVNGFLKEGGILIYYNAVWQPLGVRLKTDHEIGEETIEGECEKRKARAIQVLKPDLENARMQNMVLLAGIDRHGLIPDVETADYEQAMEDLMAGSMLDKNRRLFREERDRGA